MYGKHILLSLMITVDCAQEVFTVDFKKSKGLNPPFSVFNSLIFVLWFFGFFSNSLNVNNFCVIFKDKKPEIEMKLESLVNNYLCFLPKKSKNQS